MAELRIKTGVQPIAAWILAALARVASKLTEPKELVVTSVWDGVHSTNSLHYALRAVDVRTKNFPTLESKKALIELIKAELGPGYELVLESVGKINEHLHIEFDP